MKGFTRHLDTFGAHLLAIIWIAPLLFAVWAAFHSTSDAVNFRLMSSWTLDNFRTAWDGAPWLRYFLNTFILVTIVLVGQLLQLFILPEVLIVENYAMVSRLGLFDTIVGVGMPYMASAFGIFLMRQAFKSVPIELDEAARIEGCSRLGVLLKVYVPLAKPTYLAYALVSVSTHWNNFLWPLIVTNSPDTRPLTVGLSIFGAPENGVDISVISAATFMSVAPLLLAFLVFQRQFVQAFLRAGIK
jgi:sn-glycerol 3-phosphate transport system permease protein